MIISSYIANIFKTINYTLLYTDFITVYRQIEVELENGSRGYKKKRIYNKMPCKLSMVIPDKSLFVSIDVNPVYTLMKIFCDTSLIINKGDYISCLRIVDGHKVYYQGEANKPVRYIDGHQEIFIQDTAEGSGESFEEDQSDVIEDDGLPPEEDNDKGEKDSNDSFSRLFSY